VIRAQEEAEEWADAAEALDAEEPAPQEVEPSPIPEPAPAPAPARAQAPEAATDDPIAQAKAMALEYLATAQELGTKYYADAQALAKVGRAGEALKTLPRGGAGREGGDKGRAAPRRAPCPPLHTARGAAWAGKPPPNERRPCDMGGASRGKFPIFGGRVSSLVGGVCSSWACAAARTAPPAAAEADAGAAAGVQAAAVAAGQATAAGAVAATGMVGAGAAGGRGCRRRGQHMAWQTEPTHAMPCRAMLRRHVSPQDYLAKAQAYVEDVKAKVAKKEEL
jgi:hypothetical protein